MHAVLEVVLILETLPCVVDILGCWRAGTDGYGTQNLEACEKDVNAKGEPMRWSVLYH
jgi:hypothetical protein